MSYSKQDNCLVECVSINKTYSIERIKSEISLAQERLDFWNEKLEKARELGVQE